MLKTIKILVLTLTLFAGNTYSQDLFFSEYTANGYTNLLEIFNPTADTVELNRYSIRRNSDTFRFNFPGGILLPYSTWVGCRNEPSNPPDPQVLAVADTSWPAAGSIWFLSNNAMIELLKDGEVIDRINGNPRNGLVAGIESALDKHTLIRKPLIHKGETDWDISRGFNPDDSQWLVSSVNYSDLKKHSFIPPGSAVIWSDWFEISASGGEKDTIYFVPLNSTGNDLLGKVSTIPGVKKDFFRGANPIEESDLLQPYDELVVWNLDTTKSHTYVIRIGNYNFLKETLIISEVLYAGLLRAIEICNTSSQTVDLTGWGIGKDDATSSGAADEFTSFPSGLTLESNETFVIGYIQDESLLVPSSNVASFAEYVLPYFDIYEKGAANLNVLSKINSTSSFVLRDNTGRIVDRFQPGKIAGISMAFNMASLTRKPFVSHGEPIWNTAKEAQKESSTWIWKSHTYLDLGKHLVYKPDTAFANSDFYSISVDGVNDSIFPLKQGITGNEFLADIKSQYAWALQIKKEGSLIPADEVIPQGSVLEVISTDLTYVKTYTLVFGKNDLQLSSPEMSVVDDTIVCNDLYATNLGLLEKLNAPEGGQMEVVNSIGNVRSGFVNYGDRVLVTAEDHSQKYYFIDFRFPSGYTLIRSPFYPVDTLLNAITGIPEGENSELVKLNIILAKGQQMEILDNQGQVSTIVKTGDIVRITALNGTSRDYHITIYSLTPTKQVWDEPSQTTLPPGLKRSDVYLRSLRHSTLDNYPGPVNIESGKPWETIDGLKGFHCTQLRWVSGTGGPSDFIHMIQNAGFKYQSSVNPRGSLLKDDNYFEPIKGVIGDQCCPNKPGTAREYFNQLRNSLELGSEGLSFHSDGARWLMEEAIDDILICYCDFCNAKRAKSGISNPLSPAGKQFMLTSMLNLLDSVHTHFEDSLGHKIEWSANNGSPHSMNDMIRLGYNTPYGEVTATEKFATAAKLITDFRTAEKNGKIQLFQICSKEIDADNTADDVLNVEQYDKFVCINRSHYAFAYAAGGLSSLPWDSFTGTNQTRHFGLLSEFADLSGFIRGVRPLLDDYESGFDFFRANGPHTGISHIDSRFSSLNAPVEVEGNNNAAVFVRVKPDDQDAPVMVHLTEWFHIYEANEFYVPYKFRTRNPYTLKLRKSSFFNGAPFSIKLLTPAAYSKTAHELSRGYSDALLIPGSYRGVNESPAYRNLVREDFLDYTIEGDFVHVQIPILPHYGILKIEKSLGTPAQLTSLKYQICGNNIFIPDQLTVETLLAGLSLTGSATMLVQNSQGFNKYSGAVEEGDLLAVLSENQSSRVYSILSGESTDLITIKYNNSGISAGEIMDMGKVNLNEDKEWSFTLLNTNTEEFIVSEISSSLEHMKIMEEIESIAPGDSAIFKIMISHPPLGKNYGTIKISGESCNQLPFHFHIRTDVVAADLLVRHKSKEITEGGTVDFGNAVPGEELIEFITLINYGKSELQVSDIVSSNGNMTITPRNLSLAPAASAEVEIKIPVINLGQQAGTFYIQNNSYGPDSLLNIHFTSAGRAALIKLSAGANLVTDGDTLDFGQIPLQTNASIDLLISNEGNETLGITRIWNESMRVSFSAGASSLIPGGSRLLTITWSPVSAESWVDSIHIQSSSYQQDDLTLYIKGESLISGLSKNTGGSEVHAYPNPFRDKLWLENTAEYEQMKVVDVSGKVIRLVDINNRNSIEWDADGLEEGFYTIILTGENKIRILKVSKQ